MSVRISIDGRDHEMPPAFRAIHILAEALLDATYRIFRVRNGLLEEQLHVDEWVLPEDGDRFVCVPHAIGPGGGDDRRVRMISAAIATEHGDAEAWGRFNDWERSE
jgi:hypothetical protein